MPDGPVQWYLWPGANIGIAGVMLWVVFAAYQKLVARLADLIEKNTTAMWEEGIRIIVLAVVYFLFNGYRYERSQRKQLEARVEDLTWKR